MPSAEQFLLSLANIARRETYRHDRRRGRLRLRRLFLLLGNPERRLPRIIHITGTSGKGSVAILAASMLAAAGKKTGLMISPHITHMRERWQVNGAAITEKQLAELVRTLTTALDAYAERYPNDPVSFLEIMTAIGFLFFAEERVDWAVVEAGMGGAGDTTNILPRKNIAIITNIGRDHLDAIGPTLADVAREKAGIISSGCRVFTAEERPALLAIIEKEAKKRGAIFTQVKPGFDPLATNVALATAALQSLGVPGAAIQRGLKRARLPLRMETVSRKPLIILDGAHNPDKMRATVETIKQKILRAQADKKTKNQKIRLIVEFSADKDIARMVKQLASLSPSSIACTRNTANPFRKVADPGAIARQFRRAAPHAMVSVFVNPYDAFAWTRKQQKKDDILLATGSIFLSGELRGYLTHDR